MTEAAGLAREYYRALDEGDYDALAALLSPGFVHDRPDLTLEGRERFVRFMREERPQTDTTHPVDAVYVLDGDAPSGGTDRDGTRAGSDGDVAVRGRLLDSDGDRITGFVDVFTVADGRVSRIDTFTR